LKLVSGSSEMKLRHFFPASAAFDANQPHMEWLVRAAEGVTGQFQIDGVAARCFEVRVGGARVIWSA